MVLHGVLLEYLFLGGASKETDHWWKQAGKGLQKGRWKFCHTRVSVAK